jgi:hypothetical protein
VCGGGADRRVARNRWGGAVTSREVGKTRHGEKIVGFQMTGPIGPGPKKDARVRPGVKGGSE